jgi:DNA helicase-2/ATP-dependent DNA helicase PcrA
MDELHLTWAQSRQVFGQRRLCEPSRFLVEIPRDRLEVSADAAYEPPVRERQAGTSWRPRTGAFPRSTAPAAPPATGLPVHEMRPGVKVRHPLFGVGTVLRSEGAGEDLKLTVSFTGIGAKRLVARYAGLELA